MQHGGLGSRGGDGKPTRGRHAKAGATGRGQVAREAAAGSRGWRSGGAGASRGAERPGGSGRGPGRGEGGRGEGGAGQGPPRRWRRRGGAGGRGARQRGSSWRREPVQRMEGRAAGRHAAEDPACGQPGRRTRPGGPGACWSRCGGPGQRRAGQVRRWRAGGRAGGTHDGATIRPTGAASGVARACGCDQSRPKPTRPRAEETHGHGNMVGACSGAPAVAAGGGDPAGGRPDPRAREERPGRARHHQGRASRGRRRARVQTATAYELAVNTLVSG